MFMRRVIKYQPLRVRLNVRTLFRWLIAPLIIRVAWCLKRGWSTLFGINAAAETSPKSILFKLSKGYARIIVPILKPSEILQNCSDIHFKGH